MISIKNGRQIISDFRSIYPQGLRKTLRNELIERITRPSTTKDNEIARATSLDSFNNKFDKLIISMHPANDLDKIYPLSSRVHHFSKIYDKEEQLLINKTIKSLGIELKNTTKDEIQPKTIFNILQGLLASQKAGLKLPDIIKLKHKDYVDGWFNLLHPKTIYINPKSYTEFCNTTIHETVHKNDILPRIIIACIPYAGFFRSIPVIVNKKIIKNEVCYAAKTNREEFIAYTAEKLIFENKNWSDLHPRIKNLYDILCGPKIKTK